MKIIRLIAVAILLVVIMASIPSSTTAESKGATRVTTYETPCQHRERLARGIPAYSVHEGAGLMAYVHTHLHGGVPDQALAEYWRALDACDRDEPVARWDWDNMVVARVEYLG